MTPVEVFASRGWTERGDWLRLLTEAGFDPRSVKEVTTEERGRGRSSSDTDHSNEHPRSREASRRAGPSGPGGWQVGLALMGRAQLDALESVLLDAAAEA